MPEAQAAIQSFQPGDGGGGVDGQVQTAALVVGEEFANRGARGIIIYATVASYTNGGAAPTFTPKLQIKDPAGGWADYFVAAAALSSDGTRIYVVYPDGIVAPSGVTEVIKAPLPVGSIRIGWNAVNMDATNHAIVSATALFCA